MLHEGAGSEQHTSLTNTFMHVSSTQALKPSAHCSSTLCGLTLGDGDGLGEGEGEGLGEGEGDGLGDGEGDGLGEGEGDGLGEGEGEGEGEGDGLHQKHTQRTHHVLVLILPSEAVVVQGRPHVCTLTCPRMLPC